MKFVTLILIVAFTSTLAWGRYDFWEFAPKSSEPAQTQPAQNQPEKQTGWSWSGIKEKLVTKVKGLFNWGQDANQQAATNPSAPSSEQATSPDASRAPTSGTAVVNNAQPAKPSQAKAVRMQFNQAAQSIKQIKVARIKTPAVKSTDARLSMNRKTNVPVFDFKKWANLNKRKGLKVNVKSVPALDIGTEAELDESAFDVVTIDPLPTVPADEIQSMMSPPLESKSAIMALVKQKFEKAKPAEKIIIPALKASEKVSQEKIDRLVYTIEPNTEVTLLPVVAFSQEQLQLIKGLILFEKSDQCHIASGIFADLVDSKDKRISEKSRYHLGYCLVEMSLPLEATYHLGHVIKSQNPEYTGPSLKRIVDDVPLYLETQVAEAVLSANENLIPEDGKDKANYIKAKYFLKKGQPRRALDYAQQVTRKSDKYFKAQYVAAVAEYSLKDIEGAIARQKNLAEELKKRNSDKEIEALVHLNLGRMNFQKGKYKESLYHFQQVPKEHPLWLQGLTEQAWAQLQSKDPAGAIGNMHSIQSPYFKSVYKPESYIVRAIGYLNICQYGDSYRSLKYLEANYGKWLDLMEPFEKKADDKKVYNTVITYLQGKPTMDVEGVPYQALREIARQRGFLNAQDAVNHLIDEEGAYKFLTNLIAKDKRALALRRSTAKAKINELTAKIKAAPKTPGADKHINTWKYELSNYKDFLSVYEFKLQTMKEGEKGIGHLSKSSKPRLAHMKNNMKAVAGRVLKKHLSKLVKDLKGYFENNELLKYEVYAGSGENLRYKIGGGKTGGPSKMSNNREPAGEKWDFDGEYWEDEIGHYRSSLKNNCQASGR